VIEQCRIGVAEMQIPVRARRKTKDSGLHRRYAFVPGLTGRFPSINQIIRAMTERRDMHSHIHTDADLDAGLAALRAADPRFIAVLATAGRPPLRRRPTASPGSPPSS